VRQAALPSSVTRGATSTTTVARGGFCRRVGEMTTGHLRDILNHGGK
jgi:hypothetical protein